MENMQNFINELLHCIHHHHHLLKNALFFALDTNLRWTILIEMIAMKTCVSLVFIYYSSSQTYTLETQEQSSNDGFKKVIEYIFIEYSEFKTIFEYAFEYSALVIAYR
jgi:hypothetical protein